MSLVQPTLLPELRLNQRNVLPKANITGVFNTLGARYLAVGERERNDFYATEPAAIDYLMQIESFQHEILEPCCGQGHMSEAIKAHGHDVESFDLIDRGYGAVRDFLSLQETDRDIITNPPYRDVVLFIRKGISLLQNKGQKLALLMRLLTLEGKARKIMFEKTPPIRVWVSSGRLNCAKGADFENGKRGMAQAYAWFVWQAGYKGDTILKWF